MSNQASIEKLQWKEIRALVSKKIPLLAKIIDAIDPGKEFPVYKVRYPFGTEILKNSHLYLPTNKDNQLMSIFDNNMDPQVREDLGYNLGSNPVSILLKNSAEIFMHVEHRTVPLYGLMPEGTLFGLWRVLSPNMSHSPAFLWGMTAGARSLFMLPKIAREISHKKLCRALHLHIDAPTELDAQWAVFKAIDQHSSVDQAWETELLFFSHHWFQCFNDPAWHELHRYLLQEAWQGSEYWRSQYTWDVVYSVIQERRNIKYSPHIINGAKHILSMSEGALPGFAPAIDDSVGPIQKIQQAYIEHYNLDYAPIIMQPYLLSMEKSNRPVYYSLQYPTTIEYSPKSSLLSSKINDLYEISLVINKFTDEIKKGDLNLASTPIYNSTQTMRYDFFHKNDANANYPSIKSTDSIPLEDQNFIGPNSLCPNMVFPSNSTFLSGCIKVSKITP